jgi:two-component system OmpR family sensor kinase
MMHRLTKDWTIRFKLSLIYPILVSGAFLAFAFILYGYFSRNLSADFDAFLESKADGIEESIQTYWQTEGLPASGAGTGKPDGQRRLDAKDFTRIARSWVNDQGETPQLLMVGVQIFGTDGAVIAASPRIAPGIGLSREAMDQMVSGHSSFETIKLAEKGNNESDFRLYTRPVGYAGSPVYYVQVVSSLMRVNSSLANLIQSLLVLVPIIILITAAIVYYLTRTTLMPIQRMIGSIRNVSEQDLLVKFDIPASGRELRDLAISFNSMMERVNASFRAQARFFDDVSHQLKTPLAVLKGDLETTLVRVRSKEEYEHILESNLEEVDRIARLVNRMLSLARFDAGQVELRLEQTSIRDFLNSIEDELHVVATAHGCNLSIKGENDAAVVIDREKTSRVLAAVVENAVEHSRSGDVVLLSCIDEGETSAIEVRDCGPGIPDAELGKIFERFYRGSTATGNGFGIGLSMARSIMRLQGGDVSAANAPSGGAIFTLHFSRTEYEDRPVY